VFMPNQHMPFTLVGLEEGEQQNETEHFDLFCVFRCCAVNTEENVWRDVPECMEGCPRMYGGMSHNVWRDVPECIGGCPRV